MPGRNGVCEDVATGQSLPPSTGAGARGDCTSGRRGDARGEVGGHEGAVANGLPMGQARLHGSTAIAPLLGMPLGRGVSCAPVTHRGAVRSMVVSVEQ